MAMWYGGTASFATRRPATQADHLGGSPGFIDEDKSPRVEVELPLEPGLAGYPHIVALLFARMYCLFLNVMPRLSKKCQTVALQTESRNSDASCSAIL